MTDPEGPIDIVPAEEVAPVAVPGLATETTNTFRQPDGSFSMEVYTGPVNYQTADGSWVPIETELVEAPGETFAAQNAANDFSVKIPADAAASPVRFETTAGWVTMRMRGLDGAPEVEGSTASFEEVEGADEVT